MSDATEAMSVVDAIALGRYDRFLLSIHLAVQERMRVLHTSVSREAVKQADEMRSH